MSFDIRIADYHSPEDAEAIRALMDIYARDPMGGGKPLSPEVMERVIPMLARFPGAFTVLALAGDIPVGLVTCIETLSTFRAMPIVNIHDLVVHPDFRGWGIALMMLQKVEEVARERGCCKLTLEVLDGNKNAKSLYSKFGFRAYELKSELGKAAFWHKLIDPD